MTIVEIHLSAVDKHQLYPAAHGVENIAAADHKTGLKPGAIAPRLSTPSILAASSVIALSACSLLSPQATVWPAASGRLRLSQSELKPRAKGIPARLSNAGILNA